MSVLGRQDEMADGHTKLAVTYAQLLISTHGAVAAEEITEHQLNQLIALTEVVKRENIDCELSETHSFDVYFDESQAREARRFLEEQRQDGISWSQRAEWIEESESDKVTGTKCSKGAIRVPAVSLWPYKLVTGLLGKALERGGKIYTNTLVTNVEENVDHTVLKTTRGILKANKTIFATNAYTAALLNQYKDIITPVKGQNSQISIGSKSSRPPPLQCTYNLRFAQGPDYLVPRPDGTMILGGAKWKFVHNIEKWWNNVDDTTLICQGATDHFDSVMADTFHGWENAEAHHDMVWTGSKYNSIEFGSIDSLKKTKVMGVTPDMLPHVGRVPGSQNQWILAGFNGAGMLLIFTMTQAISKMVTKGVEYEDTGLSSLFQSTFERLHAKWKS